MIGSNASFSTGAAKISMCHSLRWEPKKSFFKKDGFCNNKTTKTRPFFETSMYFYRTKYWVLRTPAGQMTGKRVCRSSGDPKFPRTLPSRSSPDDLHLQHVSLVVCPVASTAFYGTILSCTSIRRWVLLLIEIETKQHANKTLTLFYSFLFVSRSNSFTKMRFMLVCTVLLNIFYKKM